MSWKAIIEYCVKHWYTVIPATVILWPTIVTFVVGFDIIVNSVKFLIMPQFGTDMTGYEIMEIMVHKHAVEEGLVE